MDCDLFIYFAKFGLPSCIGWGFVTFLHLVCMLCSWVEVSCS